MSEFGLHDMWEGVVGLEIHVELMTNSKIFCGCSTEFGKKPNSNTCPVCLGLPGSLPVLNEKALEYAIKAGLALNCRIARECKFDRKSYFYPDLPKGFQTSQYDQPLCTEGSLTIPWEDSSFTVGIKQIHVEEEVGKSVHSGDSIIGSHYSLMDYNRSGIPLIEIVTKPDLKNGEQARLCLEQLRAILRYIGVSDCRMQEGSIRCDANVSIKRKGQNRFGTKTEVKNMNSFRSVQRAVEYELLRQQDVMENGGEVIPQTRHWDDASGKTVAMRSKQYDHGYVVEVDIPPLKLTDQQIEQIHDQLPELPLARKNRFVSQYGLPAYDAEILTAEKAVADFYEKVAAQFGEYKMVSNWIMGEVLRLIESEGGNIDRVDLAAGQFIGLLKLVHSGRISSNAGKEVLEEMFNTHKSPEEIVKERGLEQISDTSALQELVKEVIQANPEPAEQFKQGKEQVLGFLVGQVMKKSQGKANPKLAGELIKEVLTRG
jgi:aspartyl-tRNA(Asn)/glutamyl-tRNA(Gln) amidotransferase subunit B